MAAEGSAEAEMGCRVVLCDDSPEFLIVLRTVLRLAPGLTVVGEATGGREAIDLVAELDPDILLLDVSMPEMDGFETLSIVRAQSPRTSVWMLTGRTGSHLEARAAELGAAGYLDKASAMTDIAGILKKSCSAAPLGS